MKLFFRWAHLKRSPDVPGSNGRLRAFAPRNKDGVRGRPPFWPAGDPVAQSVACVRPAVSPPIRRPGVRGYSPSSVADRQVRRFGRACQAPTLKSAAQGRSAFMVSGCSSAMSGRRGSGEIRFMVGGGRPKADYVGFLVYNSVRSHKTVALDAAWTRFRLERDTLSERCECYRNLVSLPIMINLPIVVLYDTGRTGCSGQIC